LINVGLEVLSVMVEYEAAYSAENQLPFQKNMKEKAAFERTT
jgi:hypothetical protein